jgi:hypothetical protein
MPSFCHGFSGDERCPILLGKGFGPKAYHELFGIWTNISQEDVSSFDERQKAVVKKLLQQMLLCNHSNGSNEGLLSGTIASEILYLLPHFNDDQELKILHQLYAATGASSCDIAITSSNERGRLAHSLLEVIWLDSRHQFPEAQACAFADLYFKDLPKSDKWVPTFAMSKNHFRCGISFFGFEGDRWIYSDIFVYSKDALSFLPTDDGDIVMMLKFLKFFFQAGAFHKSYRDKLNQSVLVDGSGSVILNDLTVVGARVLKGIDENSKVKVLKFYPDRATAEESIDKQKMVESILKCSRDVKLISGCSGDGMCAVLDDFVPATSQITVDHFVFITELITTLSVAKVVHGDLREVNIVFKNDGTVGLLDFEWAAKEGAGIFPARVNKAAFGKVARKYVGEGNTISEYFDWYCLADMLENIGCTMGSTAARLQLKDEVLTALQTFKREKGNALSVEICSKLSRLPTQDYLNLSRVSDRVHDYFRSFDSRDIDTPGGMKLNLNAAGHSIDSSSGMSSG